MKWKLPRFERTTVAVMVAAVVFGVGYTLLVSAAQSYYASSAPDRSVFNTAPQGLSVWYRYMEALDLAPRTLQTFDPLPADGMLVIAGPFEADVPAADAARLARWVEAGHDLVLIGGEAGLLGLDLRLGVKPSVADEPRSLEPLLVTSLTSGVRTLQPGPDRLLAAGTEWVTQLRDTSGQVLISSVRGKGSVTWLAGPYAVSNEGMGLADNAAFAVLLAGAGRTPVYFDEYHHGYSSGGGVWAGLGDSGRAAVALALLCLAVLVLARARRLGPAVAPLDEPPARTAAYIASLAELYRKAGARAEALQALEEGLTRTLARRHGTLDIGLARWPGARQALERSAASRRSGKIGRDEFLAAARGLRRARGEVEGTDG